MPERVAVCWVEVFSRRHKILLQYDDPAHALEAFKALVAQERGEDDFEIEVSDDFGRRLMVNRDEVHALLLHDMREER